MVPRPAGAVDRAGAGSVAPVSDDVFLPGFFTRVDPTSDGAFYAPTRLVTHIDGPAIVPSGRSTPSWD